MGAGFLRKLIGRSPEFPPEVREALAELTALTTDRPAFAATAHFLAEALAGLYAEPVPPVPAVLTREEALAKLEQGEPLLRGVNVPVERTAFARRWHCLCAALQRHQETTAAAALADALRRGTLDVRQLTEAALSGRPEEVHARAAALGLDAGLTATVLRLTLFPVLVQVQGALAPWHADRAWGRGYCPTCGSWPLLGEYRGLEQTRFLRCGLCAAAWEFPRLRCPFCGEADHRQLSYFYVEGEEGRQRAATCATCRGYVKMTTVLAELPPPRLLVADVATMHLDLVAAERGYELGSAPAPADEGDE